MQTVFSNRILGTKKSFIREILKVTQDPQIISFAGGLPNPEFFPVEKTAKAAYDTIMENGAEILQYTTTEGYFPLREFISKRYKKTGLDINPEEILITNGSQQGIDLLGKVFINEGDRVIIESPGYLGTIQALGIYEPHFVPIELESDGLSIEGLKEELKNKPKLLYTIPNFQNPSGISYSIEKRKMIAEAVAKTSAIIVEDDPYGELRFKGEMKPSIKSFRGGNSIMLGSFSKIVAPGLRLGWICGDKELMEKIVTAKQASDLHSNHLSQWVLYRYLLENDIDEHISKIKESYGAKRNVMIDSIKKYFPKDVKFTEPEGGMFLWVTLPKEISSMDLFKKSIEKKVAFVPGTPFFVDGKGDNTLRLNYTNSSEENIIEGIKRLARCIKDFI